MLLLTTQACASPKDLISRLNFSDESELLEGKESAGPNEDLGEKINFHV